MGLLLVAENETSAENLRYLLGPEVTVCTPLTPLGGQRFEQILLAPALHSGSAIYDEMVRCWRDVYLPTKLAPGGTIVVSPLQ